MPYGYISLSSRSHRSLLFSIVANVGPHGTSRSMAVAYRQGYHGKVSIPHAERVYHFVADTLALIEILSDPANRAPLEAERALAEAWYRRSPGGNEAEGSHERPCVPDTPQPPFFRWDDDKKGKQAQRLPELPWYDGTLVEFPFTTTCLLLGLLRDDGDSKSKKNIRPGDVQLQPLSTMFCADCAEYGLVVLDISDLDSGVKYGIVGFPVHYMAEVHYGVAGDSWDPVEDDQPVKEPDVVLARPRLRVPLSIAQWVRKYFNYEQPRENPSILRLENSPLVDAAVLDYIWPPGFEVQDEVESQDTESSKGVISSIWDYFWPPKSTTPAEDASTTTVSPPATPHEPMRKAHTDRAIDNLLLLTQEPPDLSLDERTIANFQKLAEFREQLRQRLEEVPDSLGPSSEISGLILRVAYAGCTHLNWVMFSNLAPSVIAAAIASDELRGASALSLCVDKFELEGGDKDLSDLGAALSQSTALKQLCFLQRPDRDSDDASARFYMQLLQGDSGWLRDKTIYPTCAFSTSLTTSATFTSPIVQDIPMMHIFTFVGHQREDVADADQNSYSFYMCHTLLDAERFTVRFLSYLWSVGSGSDKAILRFADGGVSSSLATNDDDKPSRRFDVSPIPAGFFGNNHTANDQSRVRVGDMHPGNWVLLIDQRDRSSSDDEDLFLQYSFVNIGQPPADIASEQEQQRIEVVGGLTEFLRETVPEIDISACEKRFEEVEKDLRAQWATNSTAGFGVMAESKARALLDQLL